jgi:hypothetical protein
MRHNITINDFLLSTTIYPVHIHLLNSVEGALLLSVLQQHSQESIQWINLPISVLERRFGLTSSRVLHLCEKFQEMGFFKLRPKSNNEFEYVILVDRLVQLMMDLLEVDS